MFRPLLIALLAFGTVAGYASGFRSLHRHHRFHHEACARHEAAPQQRGAAPSTPAP